MDCLNEATREFVDPKRRRIEGASSGMNSYPGPSVPHLSDRVRVSFGTYRSAVTAAPDRYVTSIQPKYPQ